MKNINTKTGFSLMELSIVLIVITFIMIGLTNGSALIENAKMQSVIIEFNTFKKAITTYYIQTNKMPGGESSKKMNFANSALALTNLNEKKLISKKPVNSAGGLTKLTPNDLVKSKIENAYYGIGYSNKVKRNILLIFYPTDVASQLTNLQNLGYPDVNYGAVVTPQYAQSLDFKMDNNNMETGFLRSFLVTSTDGSPCLSSDLENTKKCTMALILDI